MAAERVVRYKPKGARNISPMRKGTVAAHIAAALLRKRGATIAELQEMLIAKFGEPQKFRPNYVSGYLWDLGRRGYGLEYDRNGRYYLILPASADGLIFVREGPRQVYAGRKSAGTAGRGAVKSPATRARKPREADPAPRRARGAAKAEAAPRATAKAAKRPARTSARKTVETRAAPAKRSRKAGAIVTAEKRKRVRKVRESPVPNGEDEEIPTLEPADEGQVYEQGQIDDGREYSDRAV